MSSRLGSASVSVRLSAVALCLLVTWVYLGRASRAEELPPREPLSALSMVVEDWLGRDEPRFSEDIEAVLGVDDYVVRSYRRADSLPVGLYIGYHSSQRQGDTIHSPLNCLPGAGWQPLEQGRQTFTVRGAPGVAEADDAMEAPIEVNRVMIGKGLDRQLVYYWYQSHRRVVASEYWGKIYTVIDSVRDHRTDAALVRVIVPVPDDTFAGAAEAEATAFIKALFPLLGSYFPE